MSRSGILKNVIQYKNTNKKTATHFVLCNCNKIRYFITLRGGKKRLSKNLSSYSKKLGFLMSMMGYLPFQFMEILNLGYFVEAEFCDEVSAFMKKNSKPNSLWNIIIGTYDDKQKLVVQLWESADSPSIYYKIGNKATNKEMISEIDFLESTPKYNKFNIPEFISAQKINENQKYNIQITKEFVGEKVEPILTDDIYKIFKELVESRGIKMVDGIPHGFSHGDFTPWNIKKGENSYTVFDWEHCGMRFCGFDLIYYIYKIEFHLNKKPKFEAMELAIERAQMMDNILKKIGFNKLQQMFVEECYNIYGDNE